jgi:hypothetical protein
MNDTEQNESRISDLADIVPVMGNYEVTPDMAKEWLSLFNYKHQRRIRNYHVENLAEEIQEGRFREYTQITFCFFDGWYYLTNGYHTLGAISKTCPVLLSVIVKPVNSMMDVAYDYARHDTHLTRPLSDALAAFELAEKYNINKTQLQWISAACVLYAYMVGDTKTRSTAQLSNDKKSQIVDRHAKLAIGALSMFGGQESKTYFNRKTTLVSAMICYGHDKDKASEFWVEIAEDDGLRRNDPRKTLLDWLRLAITTGGGGKAAKSKKLFSDHELIKGCAAAWNAFCERRELQFIRTNHAAKEVFFAGIGTFRV